MDLARVLANQSEGEARAYLMGLARRGCGVSQMWLSECEKLRVFGDNWDEAAWYLDGEVMNDYSLNSLGVLRFDVTVSDSALMLPEVTSWMSPSKLLVAMDMLEVGGKRFFKANHFLGAIDIAARCRLLIGGELVSVRWLASGGAWSLRLVGKMTALDFCRCFESVESDLVNEVEDAGVSLIVFKGGE